MKLVEEIEIGELNQEHVKQKEIEAKESVKKKINDISLSDVQDILSFPKNPIFPGIFGNNNKKLIIL